MTLQIGILTLAFGAVCLLLGTQLRDIYTVYTEVIEDEEID